MLHYWLGCLQEVIAILQNIASPWWLNKACDFIPICPLDKKKGGIGWGEAK